MCTCSRNEGEEDEKRRSHDEEKVVSRRGPPVARRPSNTSWGRDVFHIYLLLMLNGSRGMLVLFWGFVSGGWCRSDGMD